MKNYSYLLAEVCNHVWVYNIAIRIILYNMLHKSVASYIPVVINIYIVVALH